MANQDLRDRLFDEVFAWNKWRLLQSEDLELDLNGIDCLSEFDFSRRKVVDLSGVEFISCTFKRSNI